MKKRGSFILIVLLCIFAVCAAGYALLARRHAFPPPDEIIVPPLPYGQMRCGDLVFRTGTGLYSQMLNSRSADTVYYSHIGLLALVDSQWMVIHAVPKEMDFAEDFARVKMETPEQFLSPAHALHGEFVHTGVDVPERLVRSAVQYVRDSVRFDGKFDLEDSTSLYCTELVWRLYRREGVDLSEGRRSYRSLGLFGQEGCLTPEDLYRYHGNTSYFKY